MGVDSRFRDAPTIANSLHHAHLIEELQHRLNELNQKVNLESEKGLRHERLLQDLVPEARFQAGLLIKANASDIKVLSARVQTALTHLQAQTYSKKDVDRLIRSIYNHNKPPPLLANAAPDTPQPVSEDRVSSLEKLTEQLAERIHGLEKNTHKAEATAVDLSSFSAQRPRHRRHHGASSSGGSSHRSRHHHRHNRKSSSVVEKVPEEETKTQDDKGEADPPEATEEVFVTHSNFPFDTRIQQRPTPPPPRQEVAEKQPVVSDVKEQVEPIIVDEGDESLTEGSSSRYDRTGSSSSFTPRTTSSSSSIERLEVVQEQQEKRLESVMNELESVKKSLATATTELREKSTTPPQQVDTSATRREAATLSYVKELDTRVQELAKQVVQVVGSEAKRLRALEAKVEELTSREEISRKEATLFRQEVIRRQQLEDMRLAAASEAATPRALPSPREKDLKKLLDDQKRDFDAERECLRSELKRHQALYRDTVFPALTGATLLENLRLKEQDRRI